MKNYCVIALKREYRNTLRTLLIVLISTISWQIIITYNISKITAGDIKILLFLSIFYIVSLFLQVHVIKRSLSKFKSKENTEFVRSIQCQFPVNQNQDLDYLFTILNTDFNQTNTCYGNYYLGKIWMMGDCCGDISVALKYSNINNYRWTIISSGKSNKRVLIINCLDSMKTYKLRASGSYKVYQHLSLIIPDKKYTTKC